MKRFSFGDDEDDEEEEEMEMEMEVRRMLPDDFISMTQFGSPDNDLMVLAIKVCEKSWWWKFRSVSSKLKMITEAFFRLRDLSEDQFA